MIRYALVCASDHGFEAWFRDSAAFDAQVGDHLVSCPACGSVEIRKGVMAPAIRTRRARAPATPAPTGAAPAAGTPPQDVAAVGGLPAVPALDDERSRQLRGLLRELHATLRARAEDLGPQFPTEARRIHEGETPPRPIYGTATRDEVRALVEDGVEIMPLPPLPDERN